MDGWMDEWTDASDCLASLLLAKTTQKTGSVLVEKSMCTHILHGSGKVSSVFKIIVFSHWHEKQNRAWGWGWRGRQGTGQGDTAPLS